MWIFFAITSAFFQAVSMAYSKRLLKNLSAVRNAIAAISFLVAGVIIGGIYFFTEGKLWCLCNKKALKG